MKACPLTERQTKIVSMLADGLGRQQAAAVFDISESLVCIDIRSAADLLRVKRKDAAIVAKMIREGWLQ